MFLFIFILKKDDMKKKKFLIYHKNKCIKFCIVNLQPGLKLWAANINVTNQAYLKSFLRKKILLKIVYITTNLVEMRLKTALKLLQLSEKSTADADARSSAAWWWPSRYVWMKWQISGSNCLTSMVSSRRKQSLDCWEGMRRRRWGKKEKKQISNPRLILHVNYENKLDTKNTSGDIKDLRGFLKMKTRLDLGSRGWIKRQRRDKFQNFFFLNQQKKKQTKKQKNHTMQPDPTWRQLSFTKS